jgi:hypothetical protein
VQIDQPVPRPWYQYFPFDFVAENMIPYTIRDIRVFEYNLVPEMIIPAERLLEQATPVRQRGQQLVPLAPVEQLPQPAPVVPVPQPPPGAVTPVPQPPPGAVTPVPQPPPGSVVPVPQR